MNIDPSFQKTPVTMLNNYNIQKNRIVKHYFRKFCPTLSWRGISMGGKGVMERVLGRVKKIKVCYLNMYGVSIKKPTKHCF
jgi:hypothetical protein